MPAPLPQHGDGPHGPVRARKHERSRSRSPGKHSRSSHKRRRGRGEGVGPPPLPLQASPLSKRDYEKCCWMFAEYLQIQKQLDIDELEPQEIRGRWKSFVGKWNRGELAEGWYDPKRLQESTSMFNPASTSDTRDALVGHRRSQERNPAKKSGHADASSSSDSGFGPSLPPPHGCGGSTDIFPTRSGPSIPGLRDLTERTKHAAEAESQRQSDLRLERKLERKAAVERLDELADKPEAGTRAAQLAKRVDQRDSNARFAAAKGGGDGMVEIGFPDLVGEEDELENLKRTKREQERKKSEREIRREEIARAKAKEREERWRKWREKEERIMGGLRELAKTRFENSEEGNGT